MRNARSFCLPGRAWRNPVRKGWSSCSTQLASRRYKLQQRAYTGASLDKQEDQSVKENKKTALLGLVFSSAALGQAHRIGGLDCIVECSPQSRPAALQPSLGFCTHPVWLCTEHTFLLVSPFSVSLHSLRLWLINVMDPQLAIHTGELWHGNQKEGISCAIRPLPVTHNNFPGN